MVPKKKICKMQHIKKNRSFKMGGWADGCVDGPMRGWAGRIGYRR